MHFGSDTLVCMSDDVGQTARPDFSLMTVRQLREAHEAAATEHAAQQLRDLGLPVVGLRRGDPERREPDAIFDSDGRTMGIELTCVGYYERGSPEAGEFMRRSWSDIQKLLSASGPAILMGPELMNFDEVTSYVQSLVDQKCTKNYSVPTILVVCAVMGHVALTAAHEGPAILSAIRVPTDCPFVNIYVRMQHNGTGVIELLPLA